MLAVSVEAPHALQPREFVRLTPASTQTLGLAPQPAKSVASGVGDDVDAVFDSEVEAVLEQVRKLRARGDNAGAAALLDGVLRRQPAARVKDSLGYERALLLARAHDVAGACRALADHAASFPNSENAADVRARLAACR